MYSDVLESQILTQTAKKGLHLEKSAIDQSDRIEIILEGVFKCHQILCVYSLYKYLSIGMQIAPQIWPLHCERNWKHSVRLLNAIMEILSEWVFYIAIFTQCSYLCRNVLFIKQTANGRLALCTRPFIPNLGIDYLLQNIMVGLLYFHQRGVHRMVCHDRLKSIYSIP